MAETKELKKIKKLYGENFMKLCRELFPTLLEHEGLLTEILTSSFATNTRTLFEDIEQGDLEEEFENFVYNKVDVEKETPEIIEEKTPYKLLEKAGYNLYECNSEKEIQKFKKYYKPDENLCTFNGGRLNRCIVFFAVKKDAEKIKREDFKRPKREDEYGTSVMSIQFSKTKKSTVSIKNRYNHTVNNPDATYGNDLDKIIPGLTQSFANLLSERGLELNNSNVEKFSIPNYTVAGDGKYYKYNKEIKGIYYCPGNIIIDNGNVVQLEPEKQVLIDYFILDKERKTLSLYDENIIDSFIEEFKDIETIEVKKTMTSKKDDDKEKGRRKIIINKKNCENPIIIEINKDNSIVGYKNEELVNAGDDFLFFNEGLTQLELPKLERVGHYFLEQNEELRQLDLPNLKKIGDKFLYSNKELEQLELSELEYAGRCFLNGNIRLRKLNLPKLKGIADDFLINNEGLRQLDLPSVVEVGDNFLFNNKELRQLNLPKLECVGRNFLYINRKLNKLEVPNLEKVAHNGFDSFLYHNIRFNSEKIIKKNKLNKIDDSKSTIDEKNIAELDKETGITTSEISWGKRVIEKIKSIFNVKEEDQR